MDKKEAKLAYLRKQLDDPNLHWFERQRIQQRLGMENVYYEEDFVNKCGYELLRFVAAYLEGQLPIIKRNKRTNSPLDFFTNAQKTIYYLSSFDCFFEEDTLEQLYDNDNSDEIKGLVEGFKAIGRFSDAELVSLLLNKRKITDKEVEQLINHFREDEKIVLEIETEVEKFIRANIQELLKLQNAQ